MIHQPAPARSLFRITAGLITGLFLAGLDMSVVNIMLPSLGSTFSVPVTQVALVVTVYVAVMAATQMFFGRLADIWQAENLFCIGLLLFTVSSMLCGLSQDFWHLILARVSQGLGAAMAGSASGAVVMRNYPADRIGSIIGVMMMAVGIGNACGPPIGGWLLEHASWHWVFLAQIPLGLVSCICMGFKKPRKTEASRPRLDWQGTFWSILGLPLLLAFLAEGAAGKWHQPNLYLYLAGFLVCLWGFVRSEINHPYPLVRFSAFRNISLSVSVSAKTMVLIIMQGWVLAMPFFLMDVCTLTPSQVGVILLALSLSMMVTTPVMGRFIDKGHSWRIMASGVFLLTTALLSALYLNASLFMPHLFATMIIFGGGMAAVLVSTSAIILKSAPKGEEGMYSAFNTVLMPMGSAMGSTIFSGIYMIGIHGKNQANGLHYALYGMLTITVVIALSLWIRQARISSGCDDE